MNFLALQVAISEILSLYNTHKRELLYKSVASGIIDNGGKTSKLAMVDETEVHLTPYAKNILEKLEPHKDRLLASDDITKLDEFLENETRRLLVKFCGEEDDKYPEDLLSVKNYFVDCGRNFKTGTKWRHIIPEMNEARLQEFMKFAQPFTDKDWDFKRLIKIPSVQLAINHLDHTIPQVASSNEWKELNHPFMVKHTNVGYPYFKNDRAKTSSGETYGELVDREARNSSPRDVFGYPFIAFGRNQRQKARPILGGSRITSLVYNQLEAVEIQTYKDVCTLFSGYNDKVKLKELLIKMATFCEQNNLTCINRDYSKFDLTVTPALKLIIGGFNYIKTTDGKGKDIVKYRTISSLSNRLICGLYDKKVMPIFGRIFSGEIDTNAGGGKVNALVSLSSLLEFCPEMNSVIEKAIKGGLPYLMVMGDDNLMIQPKHLDDDKYTKYVLDTFGLDVSSEKGEKNVFFLQNRLFKKEDGSFVMITPFTRIIRSLMNKERSVGLGPAGGTLATLQLLSYLLEWPEIMVDVANTFIIPFDENKLYLNLEWDQLTKLVGQEDSEVAGPRKLSTYEKLFDGDPQKVIDWASESNPVRLAFELLKTNSMKTHTRKD